MEDLALYLHLIGVIAFASGIVLAAAAFEAARGRRQAREVAALLGLSRLGALAASAGGLVLFSAGAWLVSIEDIGFGKGWVATSIALFVVAMGLGAVGGRRPKQARLLAERVAEEGEAEVGEELRALLDDPGSRIASYGAAALVPVILALMVFKPF